MSKANKAVGIVGYGRFGGAFAGLLEEAGEQVLCYDPRGAPDAIRAPSLEALAAGSRLLIIATPVPTFERVLTALAPHLNEAHLIADVGSVKVGPSAVMQAQLGARVPWVATHPLFGPASLARAERPLRVVVCPNPQHPDAQAKIVALYERVGCQVILDDAETHDQVMADTHALTFFVTKGILDAGMTKDIRYAPPSFSAIERTLETVRSDAGHLFMAIQHENPHAESTRKRLIEALARIDRELDETAPGVYAGMDIPDLGPRSPDLQEAPDLLEELDQELLELLARRVKLEQRSQGRARLTQARAHASKLGLDAAAVEAIFEAIQGLGSKAD